MQLRSLVRSSGELEVSLHSVPVPEPGADEVLVRIEATPINPSDLGLLFGPADMSTMQVSGTAERPVLSARIPDKFMKAMAARADESMPVGNEGAGTVVKAGSSPAAQALLGKKVAIIGGAMYAQYRSIAASQCLVLPADATAADGASCFVNPLTALGMVETMKREGHSALVHTAAASNLGQMLNRICLKDGIALVNIVRKPEQAALLRELGAKHVCDLTSPTFIDELTDALAETGATIAFDAIGGGKLAGQILSCMEAAINRKAKEYSRYGSAVHKQVYLYGMLDTEPDRGGAQLRHGLGHGRLAAVSVPAEDRAGRGQGAARARGRRTEDHLRQPLHAHRVAGRGAVARGDCGVCAALDRRQVPDRPEPLKPRRGADRPPRQVGP